MKFTIIILLFSLLSIPVLTSERSSGMQAIECSSFCPGFCKGKCGEAQVKAFCEKNKCHCGCSTTAVGCKTDECDNYCKEHSGGRHYESSCSKPHLCKCTFGDSTDHLNRVNYTIPKDAHYNIIIKPE